SISAISPNMPANTARIAPRKRSPKYFASVPVSMARVLRCRNAASEALGHRVAQHDEEVWRLDDDATRDRPVSKRDRAGERHIFERQEGRRLHADHGADESDEPQQRDAAHSAEQRPAAALSRRARCAKIDISEDHERERIERRDKAVVEFGAELAGLRL